MFAYACLSLLSDKSVAPAFEKKKKFSFYIKFLALQRGIFDIFTSTNSGFGITARLAMQLNESLKLGEEYVWYVDG